MFSKVCCNERKSMGIRRGLTLGKYAPFHRGHQLVIDTALAEMDEVIVIIYDAPEVTTVPLSVRAAWIRQLYPSVRVIEAWDGPTMVGYTPEIQRIHEQYVINTLNIAQVTHFYSSELYGDHMSKALGAVNRQVNSERTRIPISATMIREHPYQHRDMLDPIVYRDLITNVVFVGAPSTGKSTIAQHMADAYQTVWMPEYGREYWETHQIERRLSPEQLVEIAEGHLQREDALRYAANTYLFSDTNAITTYMFGLSYHGHVDARLAEYARQAQTRYDLIFLCDTDIPYDDTWDRSGDVQRQIFQKQIIADLHLRKLPYFTLRGDLTMRMSKVRSVLQSFRKYTSIVSQYE